MTDCLSAIQVYAQRDVFKTAFAYVDDHQGGMGSGLAHGINQICICCKAGGLVDGKTIGVVDKIINAVDLKPWAEFYKSGANNYAAYKCGSCGYQWSWFKPASQVNND